MQSGPVRGRPLALDPARSRDRHQHGGQQFDGPRFTRANPPSSTIACSRPFRWSLRQSLRDQIEIVHLEAGDTVLRRGSDVESSIFPFGSTMISMIVDLGEGRSVEVASIGREGAVGGIVSCGHAPAFARAEAIVGGPAARVPMKRDRGRQGELGPFAQPVLPLFGLSAGADHAVGGVQQFSHRSSSAQRAGC